MARTVADAAVMLGLLTGEDPADKETVAAKNRKPEDYSKFLDANGLKGARIGVQGVFSDSMTGLTYVGWKKPSRQCGKKGQKIIDPANIETEKKSGILNLMCCSLNLKTILNGYLANLPASVASRCLTDLIAFNEANKDKEMPWFGQDVFIMADKKGPLTDKVYLKEVADLKRLAGKEGVGRHASEK